MALFLGLIVWNSFLRNPLEAAVGAQCMTESLVEFPRVCSCHKFIPGHAGCDTGGALCFPEISGQEAQPLSGRNPPLSPGPTWAGCNLQKQCALLRPGTGRRISAWLHPARPEGSGELAPGRHRILLCRRRTTPTREPTAPEHSRSSLDVSREGV